ncbi:MAG: succinate dehydrogenase assembly factor 2 [Vibrionaceae bacterium]
MLDEKERAKVKWSCRRGMLELDVLLMPFFENCFDALLPNEQRDFIKLLDCDDNTLFKWFMHQGASDDLALANLVERIVLYRKEQL